MKLFVYIVALVALTAGSSAWAQTGPDPNEPDTLRVDSVSAFTAGIGIVPINFFNDEELTLVEITLHHSSSQITIDSFSFAGGRLDSDDYSSEVLLNADSSVVAIFSFTSGSIPAGNGLLGNLYYSYSQTISPQVIEIDTVTWVDGPIWHGTSFRSIGGSASFRPQFVKGYLDVQETPTTFDSVWVDQVEAAPGDPVAVNVYAYNERALSKIALALDYGSILLEFDSVSFVGTRSEPAPSKTVQPQFSIHKLYTVVDFGSSLVLAPGSGPVATLHFTIQPTAPERLIVIDTTTVGIISNTRLTLTPDDGSLSFEPLFASGSVDIRIPTDVEDVTDESNLPTDYNLAQNYPNPFNPTTNIKFSLPEAGRVSVEVFNILGRRVRRLIDREMPAGVHRIVFDGRSKQGTLLASGVYFYRMSSESFNQTRKMLLVK
jgi:hypothetical protein